MSEREKILVTGGCGFIGSVLVNVLRKRFLPEKILIWDSGMYGFGGEKPKYPFKLGYMINPDYIGSDALDGVKTIIHLSGLSNDPLANFDAKANDRMNYEDTRDLVDFAIERGVPRFIFASSASVYGLCDDKISKETDEVNPDSNYAKSKRKSEVYILEKKKECKDFRPLIFRKATVGGVSLRMRFDLIINSMVKSAMTVGKIFAFGGGENWRPIIDIGDVVRCYTYIATCADECYNSLSDKHPIINIVSENFRVSELGLRIARQLKVEFVPDYSSPKDIRSYRLDYTIFREVFLHTFGFIPEGYEMTVYQVSEWIKQAKAEGIDLEDPIYNNIKWIKNCQRVCEILGKDFDMLS